MSKVNSNIVLSIAGFDPCGGAGVLADIQTFQALKVQGMAVVSAVTHQDEDEVFGVEWSSTDSIESQLKPLLRRYPIDYVKIGIVKDLETLGLVVDCLLGERPKVKIIWDPIIAASSGFKFAEQMEAEQLKTVLKNIHLVTPNRNEYEQITDWLGEALIPTNVLLKGGHTTGNDTSDRLVTLDGRLHSIKGTRIEEADKHGTGCVLSSAVLASLARGMDLLEACELAKKYVTRYLRSGKGKLGSHYEVEMKA